MEQLAILAGISIAAVASIALLFVLGMRSRSRLVLRPLIGLQRRVINPRQMRSAGMPGAYAGVIRHRGRRTGELHETPVGIVADGDGFLIALVYGPRTNWLRNVLASGTATIVHEGRTCEVDQPELVAMDDVATRFTSSDQQGFRLLGVRQALRVRRVKPDAARSQDSAARPGAAGAGRVARDLRPEDRDAAVA